MTNMGTTEGIFLNLQCDCHRVASIFIKTDQSTYQFQHLAARFDIAMDKMESPSVAGCILFSIVRTGLITKSP